jgi:alcohol dehydrogenase class IV
MSARILLPRRLEIGASASAKVAEVLADFGYQRPLLVTDPFMVSCGYLERIAEPLRAAGYSMGTFTDCVPDPTTDSIEAGLAVLRATQPDVLIGLGGGSAMDTAKMMAVLASRSGPARDHKVPAQLHSGLPIIAIPTTAGTGSEATSVAVVTDTETEEKMLFAGSALMPQAALVDYELTLTMPPRLTADTGLDTLCHALEAFVSRKRNPFTDGLAAEVMRDVVRWLPVAWAEPENVAAREAMMLAAMRGGMAFSNASVTLIHGMSRPVGAHFHVPHGMSNAMLLPTITAWSTHGAPERYAEAARILGFASDDMSIESALNALQEGLARLCADMAVPTPAEFGITAEDWFGLIPTMAQQALASGSPANNPRIPSAEDIAALYDAVWHGKMLTT